MNINIFKDSFKQVIYNKPTRNYGIDLLKIIAMINIINLHINLRCDHLKLNPLHPKYKHVYRLEAFSFWPVDAFGLISGIVNYKKYNFTNIIYLWFQYLFYSLFFSILSYNKSSKNKKILFYHFFPVGIKRHWYVNAYFFLYFFLPFIKNSINLMDKVLFNKMVLIFFLLYSFYHTLIKFIFKNTNHDYINGGYSTLWLLILYIIGAYIGRFYSDKKYFSNITLLSIYLISSFISSEYIFFSFKRKEFANNIFMEYFSPTVMFQALSLIFFFENQKIYNKYVIKIISFFIPLNFNVTLIHSKIIMFKFRYYIKSLSSKLLFFKLYGISIFIYLISAMIDYFRFLLFKFFRIRTLCDYIKNIIF